MTTPVGLQRTTLFDFLTGGRQPGPAPAPTPARPAFTGDSFQRPRRQDRYRLEVDIVGCRIYVLDKVTGQPVDRYLTSPGTAKHPTRGDNFTIDFTATRAPWNPPKSAWAKNAKVAPGGPQNPMGIFKMSLGQYAQYIHGTPDHERAQLGKPASHGCLRMSNENVLQLFERYAGKGTDVHINRDPARSRQLQQAFKGRDHKITDGAELLPAAIGGKAPTPRD